MRLRDWVFSRMMVFWFCFQRGAFGFLRHALKFLWVGSCDVWGLLGKNLREAGRGVIGV